MPLPAARRLGAPLGALAVLAACSDATAPALDAGTAAPLLARAQPALGAGGPIAGRYVVVLADDVPDVAAEARGLAARHGGQLGHVYTAAVKGFAIALPAPAAEALARHPRVRYVEPDQRVTVAATQSGATWGIDRIDQRALPLGATFTYTRTGYGVTAYIVDTGLDLTHAEFSRRARSGFDAFGGTGEDCHGHGTHVGGTVGGKTYGVAKAVNLVAVRVLGCDGSGTTSGVIAGVDWITAHHQAGAPAVANLSLGGGASQALDDAVRRSIADGVSYVVAAGNSNVDACTTSPARVAAAVTVGASDRYDRRASFSNHGACLDLFAPGVGIKSAAIGAGTTETATMSGTSMAAPHAAGVVAQYLQRTPTASPATVAAALQAGATRGVVTNASSANNHLLFTNY